MSNICWGHMYILQNLLNSFLYMYSVLLNIYYISYIIYYVLLLVMTSILLRGIAVMTGIE